MLAGVIFYKVGFIQAAVDTFTITINGKGGHGAISHKTVNPRHRSSEHRQPQHRTFQLMISAGSINSGKANNVIPTEAVMTRSIRSYEREVRTLAAERLSGIATQVAHALGCTGRSGG